MITRTITIDCSETAEFIARALRTYNSAPGSDPETILWPFEPRSSFMHYIKQGQFVEQQLAKAGLLVPSEREKS